MHDHGPETLLALIRRRNNLHTDAAGKEVDVPLGLSFLRAQNEEAYKVLIGPVIAYFLNNLVNQNKEARQHCGPNHYNGNAPDITVRQYIDRIIKYSPCSPECFLVGLIFIDRLVVDKLLRVSSLNVHRLIMTSVLLASKILEDLPCNNKYYSHVGGLSLKELNVLERHFVFDLNYNLNVTPLQFEEFRNEIEVQLVRLMASDEIDPLGEPENLPLGAEDDRPYEGETSPPLQRKNSTAENARMLAKRLRRSRSFNSNEEKRVFNWRKRRSTSFNIRAVEA